MAKTKISELVKTYNVDSKDIIAYLNSQGIEAKTASKSIDDDAVKLVASKFGSKPAEPSVNENKAPVSKEEPAKPKKKKIIIVTGSNTQGRSGQGNYVSGYNNNKQNNNNRPANQQGGNQGARPAQNAGKQPARAGKGPAPAAVPYRPIKPKTVPSQMKVDFHKPVVNVQKKPVPAPKAEENAAPVQAPVNTAASAPAEMPVQTAPAKSAPVQTPEANTQAPAARPVSAPAESAKPVDATASAARPMQEKPAEDRQARASRPQESGNGFRGQSRDNRDNNRDNNRDGNNNQRRFSNGDRAPRDNRDNRDRNQRPNSDGRRFDRNNNGSQGQQGGRIRMNDNAGRQGGQQNGFNRGPRDGQQNGFSRGPRDGQQGGFNRGSRDGQQGGFNRGPRDGQQGGYNRGPQGQGGFSRGSQGGQQGGFNRGPQGQRSQGNSSFASANEPAGFGNESRRRNNQFKDKRNKKDMAFAEDEQREKKNRSGRFVKPVAEQKQEPEEQIKVITIPEKLTIGELAEAMHMKAADLIKKLFLSGKAMTVNSELKYEEAEEIASDYDILCEKEEKIDVIEELLKEDAEREEDMVSRPPVICVMGHVDHGKTSILDYIRDSHVTAKEAGGITQAIGAYTVKTEDGRDITFLDTPGHEAFTAMRLRGAQSTDIAVLVVAADDGVMPQTVEAINHAKAAGVEIIVAVNKIDKPAANPDRVKEQLSKYELIPSEWGGSTEFVNVSAKTGQGIDDLLETILLTADVLELKANPDRLARGLVLEARLDKGRGPVANVLVQKGTLHVGDFVSAGPAFGKVRAMINDKGKNVKEAGPSVPVMVMGLSDVPSAGEVIVAHSTNDEAKSYAQTYKAQHKEELVAENVMSMNVEDLFDQMREGKMKELELIVKADVQGSVEALCTSLRKLSNDEVTVKIIHSAVGNISESDVNLAEASNAAIIGFNVHPDATAKSIADHGGVSIHLYKVIYQAIDDVDAALKGMLAPVYEEKVIGHAEVRQIFKSGKIGNIAGCMVLDGVIEKGCSVRITRDKDKVFEGDLESLKRFKDDVKEVKAGFDCGLVFKGWGEMNVDDQIEAYKMVEVPREQVIAMKEREAKAKAEAEKKANN